MPCVVFQVSIDLSLPMIYYMCVQFDSLVEKIKYQLKEFNVNFFLIYQLMTTLLHSQKRFLSCYWGDTRDVHRHFKGQGLKWKKGTSHTYYYFF